MSRAALAANFPLLRRFLSAGVAAYLLLIFYGSLYPFSEWTTPDVPLFSFLRLERPKYLSLTDIAVNIVVYIPLGLMLTGLLRRFMGLGAAMVVATLAGGLVSLAMETLQMFLPGRVSSVIDLGTNVFGTLVGAMLAWLFHPRSWAGQRIFRWRGEWFQAGALVDASLLILLLCMLAELPPLLPSLQGERNSLSVLPLWQVLLDSTQVSFSAALIYGLKVLGFGLLATLLVRPDRPPLRPFIMLLAVALFAKMIGSALLSGIPLYAWRFSLRASLGLALGLSLLWPLTRLKPTARALLSGTVLTIVFILQELAPGQTDTPNTFNWVPFVGQMYGFTGILDIVAAPALFLAIGAGANLITPPYRRAPVLLVGGTLAVGLAFGLEFAQQFIPGRSPDITDVVLYSVGWFLPWLWRPPVKAAAQTRKQEQTPRHPIRAHRPLVYAAVVVTLFLLGLPLATMVVETPLDGRRMHQLPLPEELAPVNLPGFRVAHPRLPAPSPEEIQRLQRENPGFFRQQETLAKNGDVYAAILLARAFPGSQDLEQLHRRVLKLKIQYRGNNTELIALAYDWLYDQWTEAQRLALRDKLADGSDFIIKLIRTDRLSPYNVFLYNSPFQRLMVASVALYKDDPRGELAMRFAIDQWKRRMLPVWRQIMGKNGGWHEGGEYIAIGIGQAVYQLPAIWRHATGEDYFKSEPGIRGFMDFILYRLRPDGTNYRLGDASQTERIASDLTPLALEYRDAAAYTLHAPKQLVPTSWPWGPLSDDTLIDPHAIQDRPLTKLFDGIGVMVARSSWSPEATYVTFKAGDNYWSHSHLDQGSFTIFKGSPLAIDSGHYGPQYGSDHHMNYAMQTIAHNVITVTDPADTKPVRGKRGERAFANDGGQRRIGSGWGIEPAPMDLDEWNAKREIYHTAGLEQYAVHDGVSVAVADLTPAYTNGFSGDGTFSHRTRRVERHIRTFAYDRNLDAVVVFDRIIATDPSFATRWLLHTIERPQLRIDGFALSTNPRSSAGRLPATLQGIVLLPKSPRVALVGGPGAEFLVDGHNYDEDGKLAASIKLRGDTDAGNWRVEVSPQDAGREHTFLTVLFPALMSDANPGHARLTQEGSTIACDVSRSGHIAHWRFDPESGRAEYKLD
jgi:VanZ family protein